MRLFQVHKNWILLSLLLMGMTSNDRYIELEGFLNARASSAFSDASGNVKTTLTPGTQGQIKETKKMPSGNYGLHIQVLAGPHKGQDFWVYYNVNHPDLKLLATLPGTHAMQAADSTPVRQTATVDKAQGAIVEKTTPAWVAPSPEKVASEGLRVAAPGSPVVLAKPPADVAPSNESLMKDAVSAIANGNKHVSGAGSLQAVAFANCASCEVEAADHVLELVRARNAPKMSATCNALVNSSGQMGKTGEKIFSILSEPRYKKAYTSSRAMGSFCPRFDTLSETQKLEAWTWFWTVLAQQESDCQPNRYHPTYYRDRSGELVRLNPYEGHGLWALERDGNLRRSRGAACASIKTADGQARCAIDIMYKRQLLEGQGGISQGSYWGPVRRGNRQILPGMKRFSPCFN